MLDKWIKYKNEVSIICYSGKILYVCNALHTQGRHDARHKDAGFFYARTLNNSGSVPPCDVLMDSLPLWCNTTGKAEPFFYFSPNINFLKMHYTEEKKPVSTCKACKQPKQPTIDDILNDFFIWQSAESVKEELWRWFITAVGSEDLDNWTAIERSNLAFLYKHLTEFIQKLEVIHLKTSV